MSGGRGSELLARTRAFAVRIIHLSASLPHSREMDVLARQLIRAGTSVGAQHREAARSRSNREFISKLQSALQELEETLYWIEVLVDVNAVAAPRVAALLDEATQLKAILITSVNTVRKRRTLKPEAE